MSRSQKSYYLQQSSQEVSPAANETLENLDVSLLKLEDRNLK
ncbi:hypothetical protein LEMLEM_LOCUS10722 [Lemmus lemmus]